jgi:hypothetical protein
LEATPRLELGVEILQTSALPLGYVAGQRIYGAGDEARTRYLHLGKVALYQMSYTCILCRAPVKQYPDGVFSRDVLSRENRCGASDRNRTSDTGIFSPLLYRLSYRGKFWRRGWDLNPRPPA